MGGKRQFGDGSRVPPTLCESHPVNTGYSSSHANDMLGLLRYQIIPIFDVHLATPFNSGQQAVACMRIAFSINQLEPYHTYEIYRD